MCEERRYGSFSTGSSPGLQVTEANVNEGEVEGSAAVHHLVEELHGQRDELDHSIIAAACRDITENNALMAELDNDDTRGDRGLSEDGSSRLLYQT